MKDTYEVPTMMTKEDVTMMILSAKKQAGMTWEEIADKIGMSPVWTHSAAMGMNKMPKDKAEALASVMGLPQEAAIVLAESPTNSTARRKAFTSNFSPRPSPLRSERRASRPISVAGNCW